jgi:hypothetical protein
MDIILAFIAGAVWYELLFLVVLGIVFIVSIAEESSFWLIVVTALYLLIFGHPLELLEQYWYYVPMYIVLGLLWSVFKHSVVAKEITVSAFKRFYTDKIIPEEGTHQYNKNKEYLSREIKDKLEYRSSVDAKLYWVLLFPISVTGYLFGDMLKNIINKLGVVYTSITNKIIQSQFDTIYPTKQKTTV